MSDDAVLAALHWPHEFVAGPVGMCRHRMSDGVICSARVGAAIHRTSAAVEPAAEAAAGVHATTPLEHVAGPCGGLLGGCPTCVGVWMLSLVGRAQGPGLCMVCDGRHWPWEMHEQR
jgi:hypothetical protein